jgi:hypothetical protein
MFINIRKLIKIQANAANKAPIFILEISNLRIAPDSWRLWLANQYRYCTKGSRKKEEQRARLNLLCLD